MKELQNVILSFRRAKSIIYATSAWCVWDIRVLAARVRTCNSSLKASRAENADIDIVSSQEAHCKCLER